MPSVGPFSKLIDGSVPLALPTAGSGKAVTLSAVSCVLPVSVRYPSTNGRSATVTTVARWTVSISVTIPLALALPFSFTFAIAWNVCVDIASADHRWSVSRRSVSLAVAVAFPIAVSIKIHIRSAGAVVIDRRWRPWRKRVWASRPSRHSLTWSRAISVRGRGVSTAIHAVAAAINIVAVKTGVSSAVMRLRSASNSSALRGGRKCRLTVMELSSVELVTFLHDRQFARLRRQWGRVQVRMLKCVDRIDAPLPIEPHEFSEEGNSTLSVPITSSDAPPELQTDSG